jgi:nucleoid DNA-binding protein
LKEEIIKPGIVRKVVEKMEDNSIVIYPETVDMVISAFLDSIVDILEEGDCVKLKGYVTIYPKYYKAKKVNNIVDNQVIDIPERYKPKIKAGSKLENACKNLMKKEGDCNGKSERSN